MIRQKTSRRHHLFNKSATAALGLLLFAAAGAEAVGGELPKEGKFSATFVLQGQANAIELGKGSWGWSNFTRIATVSDSENGLWHNISGDCLGSGLGDQGSGYCRYADSEGDSIFERWEETVIGKGKGAMLGGTGKFAGIKASFEYDYLMLPSPEGTIHLVGKKRGSYTLP